MANQDEALDLKRRARRRLTGAIALVLFLVIVPPWIMDLEPKPVETSLKVEIPKPDDRALPLPAPSEVAEPTAPPATDAKPSEPGADDSGTASVDAAKEAPASPAAKPAVKAPAKEAVKNEAPAKAAAAKRGGTYIVPVATLSAKGSVKELEAKISLAGIETYTEPVKVGADQHTRVRAGPFETKEAAEQARQRLRGMGLQPGNVTTR
ncbi:MAG TPA: SPOR domain-containing protein [Burkholderiales bacterium]